MGKFARDERMVLDYMRENPTRRYTSSDLVKGAGIATAKGVTTRLHGKGKIIRVGRKNNSSIWELNE